MASGNTMKKKNVFDGKIYPNEIISPSQTFRYIPCKKYLLPANSLHRKKHLIPINCRTDAMLGVRKYHEKKNVFDGKIYPNEIISPSQTFRYIPCKKYLLPSNSLHRKKYLLPIKCCTDAMPGVRKYHEKEKCF